MKEGIEKDENIFQKTTTINKFVVEIEFWPGILVGNIIKRNEQSKKNFN